MGLSGIVVNSLKPPFMGVLGLSGETEPLDNIINIWIYSKKLSHMTVKSERYHNTPSTSWMPGKLVL